MPEERSGPPQPILDKELIGKIIPEGDTGLDSQRTSFVGLPLATKLDEITRDSEATDRQLRPAQQILTLRHALLDPAERQRLQLRVVAIGPKEGNSLDIPHLTSSEYALYLVDAQGTVLVHTRRTKLAESQSSGVNLALAGHLSSWDTIVQEQAEIWDEAEAPAYRYNRYIQEISQIDQRLKAIPTRRLRMAYKGEPTDLLQHKYDSLLSLLETARFLQDQFSGQPLYEAPRLHDHSHPVIYFHPLTDNNIGSILAGTTQESDLERDSRTISTKISVNKLKEFKSRFDAGEETEEFGTAAAIYDILKLEGNQTEPKDPAAS